MVFFITAGIYLLGSIFYVIFASGDKQQWAESSPAYKPHTDDAIHDDEQKEQ